MHCENISLIDSTRLVLKFAANSVHLDEVAHIEPSHLDLHCLSLVSEFSI